eukprot:2806889-Ditylum_brightwellii.AAC.1
MEQKVKAKQYYHSKEKHGKLHVQMKDLLSEFTSKNFLEECHHKYDTLLNGGLNTTATIVIPKHKHMVWGEKKCWSAVFEKLGVE